MTRAGSRGIMYLLVLQQFVVRLRAGESDDQLVKQDYLSSSSFNEHRQVSIALIDQRWLDWISIIWRAVENQS